MQLGKTKKQIKNILQRDLLSKKEITKYSSSAHISLLSQTEQWKKTGGDGHWRKNWIAFKARERKQYQGNVTKNLFVVIYLMEAFKIRLS